MGTSTSTSVTIPLSLQSAMETDAHGERLPENAPQGCDELSGNYI
jgi:hypothetical protein